MSTGPSTAGNSQIWNNPGINGQCQDSTTDVEGPEKRQIVEIFKSIHDIVMEREKFLFSLVEQACLERLNAMSYPARYLLIRLCLCKRGKWHTLSSLEERYKSEIGGKRHISDAIDELCGVNREVSLQVKKEPPTVIDLTLDEDDDHHGTKSGAPQDSSDNVEQKGGNTVDSTLSKDLSKEGSTVLATDDATASLPELLACLPNDELKAIGKQLKVTKTGQNRSALMEAILCGASTQSTLVFPVLTLRRNSAKSGGIPMYPLTLSFAKDGRMKTQISIVRQLVSKVIGRCIRIDPAVFALFDRLNLVFFRSTTYSSSLLLPALLSAYRKRQYVKVNYIRTASIFPSRQALLDYEEMLALEWRVDEAFAGNGDNARKARNQKSTLQGKDVKGKGKAKPETTSSESRSRVECAKMVREIWMSVYDRWKALVASEEEETERGFEKFDCGHVLTRIMYKGAQALGILKEYDLEIEVLEALLAQTKWRRGRRGEWYDKLALVLMTHSVKSQETYAAAMDVVIRGLHDNLTHLIYRPRLERRLTRLENMLKIPKDERHQCDGQLKKAKEVYIEGIRVKSRAASVVLDKSDCMKSTSDSPFKRRSESVTLEASAQVPRLQMYGNTIRTVDQLKGKTRWLNKQGDEVSVEQLALEYYEDLGYKGFHSEGRIVSTIFGLLFWDVIFASVPGAFETPYQSAPLDIHEDTFYSARRQLVEQRLLKLEDGGAHELLKKVDDRERPGRTWCIGVNWDFEQKDLLEIVDCLGGHALAVICRMICEDYDRWRGGVPDLFVWNADTRKCKFVEVKSPNDNLQENQKVWIDVLVGSDSSVDLCHVAEKGAQKKKAKKQCAGKKRKDIVASSQVESEYDYDLELESEDEDLDQQDPSQTGAQEETMSRKPACDSDDFTPSPMKKRRVEVLIPPRRRATT